MKKIPFLTIFVCYLISLQNTFATKITWVGVYPDVNWSTASNWDLGRIPISTDSVYTFYSDEIHLPNNYIAEIKFMKLLGKIIIPGSSELIFTNGKFDALGDVINYGTIRVNNSPKEGILCSTQAANRLFHNFGKIYINNSAFQGLIVLNEQVLTNEYGGIIDIQNSGMESLLIGGVNSGIVVNDGTILLKTSGNDIGLSIVHSDSELNNSICGKLNIFDKVVMTAGLLNNAGFLKQDYDGDNDFGNLALTEVNNHGAIEDWNNSFYYSDFDVQSLWISKLDNVRLKTGQGFVIFAADSVVGINTTDIFTDEQLTINAGDYDLSSKMWTPNSNANGISTFYIKVLQQNNLCFDTIRFDLEFPVLEVIYWLGGTGSWQNAAKWSTGSVPTANDIVSIYNPSDNVGINNATADAKKIFLFGSMTITSSGILNIAPVSTDIGIDATEATITNNGTINLMDALYGIRLRHSTLINNQNILCSGTVYGIDVYGSLFLPGNLENYGTIQGTGSIILGGGSFSTITNHGSFLFNNPTSVGINSKNLINFGSIVVMGSGLVGVGIDGVVHNQLGGTISLMNLATGNKAVGDNQGLITVAANNIGIETRGSFTNMAGGQIDVKDCNVGVSIYSGGLFNLDGGTVTVNGSTQYGLHIKVPSTFLSTEVENAGIFAIHGTSGIGIYAESGLTNKGNGTLLVKSSGNHGIQLANYGASFYNKDQGVISVKNAIGQGLLIDGGYFLNYSNAKIYIDSVGLSGLYLGDYINIYGTHYGSMVNNGFMDIGSHITANGIQLEANTTLTSNECNGKINCRKKIQLDGLFINYGFYKHLGVAQSTIGTNLQNYGVVNDPNFSLPSPATWNLGYYVGEKSGIHNEGETINNIMLKHASANADIQLETMWYLDENLTQLGGTYNQSTNSFTPNGQSVDSSTFYIEVINTSCFYPLNDTIALKLVNPIKRVCGKIVWEGGTGSFFQATNWNKYRIPSPCDSVMIEGILDSVTLNDVTPIVVEHLSNYGSLMLSPLASFTIENSLGNGLVNNGLIINKGDLTIQNTTSAGYVDSVNAELTNEGSILIDSVGQEGVKLNGVITNKGTATFSIENSALENLKLINNGYFLQKGLLVIGQ